MWENYILQKNEIVYHIFFSDVTLQEIARIVLE
jgi:hypothetical protein